MNRCEWLITQKTYPIATSVKQIIMVKLLHGSYASLLACDKVGDKWQENKHTSHLRAVLGKKGVAKPGQKHEGDGKSPSGIYSFGTAFGHDKLDWIKMPYRVLTDEDKFVDDQNSRQYNTWVTGVTTAKSYESMLKIGDAYKLGIVINYNMHPVVKGLGSAIFMHVWTPGHDYTAGCVGLKYPDLVKLMQWLDQESDPHILILPPHS